MPLWLGNPGNQTQLPSPVSGLEATAVVASTTRQTIGGGQTVSRAPTGRRTYKAAWSWLETDVYTVLEEYFRGARGRGPHALLDSGRRNHLNPNQSAATSIDGDPGGFTVDPTSGERVTSNPDQWLRGPRSLRWTLPSTVATGVLEVDPPGGLIGVPTPTGQPWTFSGVLSLSGVAASVTVTPVLSWRRVDGSEVTATLGTPIVVTPGAWPTFAVSLAAPPAGAVAVRAQLRVPTGIVGPMPVSDTFTRIIAGDWGNADGSGGPWTATPAADCSVTGSVGRHSLGSVNVSRRCSIGPALSDVDMRARFRTDQLAAGAPIYSSLAARFADLNNMYMGQVRFNVGAQIEARVVARVASVETTVGAGVTVPGLTHVVAAWYWARLQVVGPALRLKIWRDGDPEPDAWLVDVTDTSITAAAPVGIRSILVTGNTNTLPVLVDVDDFQVAPPAAAIAFGPAQSPPLLAPIRPAPAVGGLGRPLVATRGRRAWPGWAADTRAPLTTTDVLVDRLQLDMAATVRPWVLGTGVPRVSIVDLPETYLALPGRACTATFVEVG